MILNFTAENAESAEKKRRKDRKNEQKPTDFLLSLCFFSALSAFSAVKSS
jgi:hypothetical protein